MPSKKQRILTELLYDRIIIARGLVPGTLWTRIRHGKACQWAWDELNFIHNIPFSLLEEEYTDNDIDFINFGIGYYLEGHLQKVSNHLAWLLIEFIEGVPENRKNEVTWTPPLLLYELARKYDRKLKF